MREDAARYCSMSLPSFLRNCPVAAKRVFDGERGLRWDRFDLDRWIDSLDCPSVEKTPEEWLAGLDGNDNRARAGH